MLLDFAWVDGVALWVHAWSYHVGALVHVGEKEGRGDGWAVVETRAPVAVTTRADLEVEWTVHAVLLGAENGSEVLCHVWIDGFGDEILLISIVLLERVSVVLVVFGIGTGKRKISVNLVHLLNVLGFGNPN